MNQILINIQELLNLNGFTLFKGNANININKVVIDSRKVTAGCLFVAIKGENFDGADFLNDVEKAGAIAVLINEESLNKSKNFNGTVISCKDTVKGFGEVAKLYRNKLNAKVIGITGSNGKTTTKEFLYTILSQKFNVTKTEYNNNNHIGVPLTLLCAESNTEIIITEQGTNHFGEIEYTAKISQPDYALITLIGDSHLEFLIDRNGVLKEKYALFEETLKKGGTIFVNNDDPLLSVKCKDINNKITFGFFSDADFKGNILGFDDLGRTKLQITHNQNKLNITLPIYGAAAAKNILAAVAIAYTLGLTLYEIITGINKIQPVKARLNVFNYLSTIIIDDTYNANPASMQEAINLLANIKAKPKKIAILGDMFELGDNSEQMHKNLAESIEQAKLDNVLLIGTYTIYTAKRLNELGIKNLYFDSREKLAEELRNICVEDTVFLFKGSRGMKMEQFIPLITERVK